MAYRSYLERQQIALSAKSNFIPDNAKACFADPVHNKQGLNRNSEICKYIANALLAYNIVEQLQRGTSILRDKLRLHAETTKRFLWVFRANIFRDRRSSLAKGIKASTVMLSLTKPMYLQRPAFIRGTPL